MGSILGHVKGQMPWLDRFQQLNDEFNQHYLDKWYRYPRWRRVMYLVGTWMVRKSGVEWTRVY